MRHISADSSPRHARSSRSISVTAWKGVFWKNAPAAASTQVEYPQSVHGALHHARFADPRFAYDQRH
jgi:hypothetical protein